MKKKRVNEILVNQTKRKNTIFSFLCAIIIISIISLSFFFIFLEKNQDHYVTYNEDSNIDYKVYLKENDFFERDYLGTNKQYIASLINYIDANFKYNLSLNEENIEYKYLYRIEADVDVKHKGTENSLFNKNKTLLDKKEINSTNQQVTIDEDIKIDYNYYNDLIKKFVNTYGLDDIESTLTINMYINVVGSCEDFDENAEKESVMSLSIPLTTKTVSIDLSNNLINSTNNVMKCNKTNSHHEIFIIISIVFAIIDLILIVNMFKYIVKTRTAENIYEKELKNILNNYSSYIQTLSSDFNFNEYQLLKLDTFTDMLEIRDTIRQPILMKENEEKTGAYFVIPSNTKILYVYRLKVSDIQKNMKKEEI